MNDTLAKIGYHKLLPVVKIDRADDAADLARALVAGGLPIAEITFRTDCAAEAISRIKKAVPGMLLGAGTVLSVEQAKAAVDAGAEFIVSPGFSPKVAGYCVGEGIPVIPGCVTPTEIEAATELGLDILKFFPASVYGGLSAIKALAAPYRSVRFIPTGGVGPENLAEYVSSPAVFACGGSFMVKEDLIRGRRFYEIKALTANAVAIIKAALNNKG